MPEKIKVHIFVSGRVQGVLYRQSARHTARELGLTGWVKNLIDGRVEMVCEGEKEKIEQFIEWAKKGPSLAKTENVEVEYEEYKAEFKDFEIREFGF